jgi:hypothetical protein
MEQHRFRMFESRTLRRIFDLSGAKWWKGAEECIMRSLITCTLHPIILGLSSQAE